MLSLITSNWEWFLLALYVLEKGIKLSPSKKDDLVLDNFMGSGTTPAVASKLGFDYVATDISEKAYNITKNRLSKIENNLFA